MHDPQTLIFGNKFFQLWHADPEHGGSDDSCGWFQPRLTDAQLKSLKGIAWAEARNPWYRRHAGKCLEDPATLAVLALGAVNHVDGTLGLKSSWETISRAAVELTNGSELGDGARGSFAFLPGWHENLGRDTDRAREQPALDLFVMIARKLLRQKRPWWQHPRFHVWHWRLQFMPALHFKRWLFSRCRICGKGFSWGYAPCSNQWGSDGPQWFRSEPDVAHRECADFPATPGERLC